MYKLSCIILNARLSKWEAEHSIYYEDNQNGFRKSLRTIDIWHQRPLSLKRENYVRKIHLQHSLILRKHMIKYIDRGILFTKLLKFGISGLMYTSQNLIRITQCKFPLQNIQIVVKPKQSADLKSVFSSTLRVQRKTFRAEKNFLVKNHVFVQKLQISGIFKKSVLDIKDTAVRL